MNNANNIYNKHNKFFRYSDINNSQPKFRFGGNIKLYSFSVEIYKFEHRMAQI